MRHRLLVLFLVLAGAPALAQEDDVRADPSAGSGQVLGAFRDTLDLRRPLRLRPFVLPQTLTLRLDGAGGGEDRIRVDLRGNTIGTMLNIENAADAAARASVFRAHQALFPDSLFERLRDALMEQALHASGRSVRHLQC